MLTDCGVPPLSTWIRARENPCLLACLCLRSGGVGFGQSVSVSDWRRVAVKKELVTKEKELQQTPRTALPSHELLPSPVVFPFCSPTWLALDPNHPRRGRAPVRTARVATASFACLHEGQAAAPAFPSCSPRLLQEPGLVPCSHLSLHVPLLCCCWLARAFPPEQGKEWNGESLRILRQPSTRTWYRSAL